VAETTRKMVVEWQRVGYVHGVMNTDNMSILGLTIDYGPYGWLEGYEPNWTPNTTDREHHRYRFGNQPNVALWNLVQLANALYPLIGETKPLEDILDDYKDNFAIDYLNMMRLKLGLIDLKLEEDKNLVYDLEEVLKLTETDMTIFFRKLADISKEKAVENVSQNLEKISDSFYKPDDLNPEIIDAWHAWLILYVHRLEQEKITDSARKNEMNRVNPKYVLRNYMAQLAIDAADNNDYSIINELYELLKKPYAEQPLAEKWFAKRPEWARNKIGCSMLSCSS
jgi:serine/tyrosine/threonine adenylyltransferase